MTYFIIPNKIKGGCNSQVYMIKNKDPPNDLLIAKIFNKGSEADYQHEKEILSLFSIENEKNEYIIHLLDIKINIDLISIENINYESKYLVFNYLKHGNLSKYLTDIIEPIPEIYIKVIAYKLLKGLKTIHENKICHNKLEIRNIMFDDKYNPIIIHFKDAIAKEDFSEDFIKLAKILAVLITNGKFKNSKYLPSKNYFLIKTIPQKVIEDKIFWNTFKDVISDDFINFFNMLAKPKSTFTIEDLFNNKWFEDINNDKKKYEEIQKNLENYFEERYKKMLSCQEKEKQIIDLNSIIDSDKINFFNKNLIKYDNITSERSIHDKNENLKIKEIKFELKGILFDYIKIEILRKFNDSFDTLKFFSEFMNQLSKNLEQYPESKDLEIQKNETMGFKINLGDNYEEQDKSSVNFEDDDEEGKESLIIYVELLKYVPDDEIDLEKYYLTFNLEQGDIFNYYHYLNILKKESQSIINKIL